MTICPTAANPYCANIHNGSRRLSETMLDALCAATGARKGNGYDDWHQLMPGTRHHRGDGGYVQCRRRFADGDGRLPE